MTLHPIAAQNASDVMVAALTSRFALTCAAIMLGCLLALVFGARAAVRLRRLAPVHARRRRSMLRDESGTATIEFALLTPIMLVLALVLAQSTLAMGAHLFVNYAAFAAARTAMVQIPADYTDDEYNVITASKGSTKFDAIQQSAVIALLPIGGSIGDSAGGGAYDASKIASALTRFYSAYGSTPPPWIEYFIAKRVGYNAANTEVRLYKATAPNSVNVRFDRINGAETLEPKDAVTVEVRHGFYLSIPYARWVFSDAHGSSSDQAGSADPKKKMTLSGSVTLTLEGITDELPPEPSLPRTPI